MTFKTGDKVRVTPEYAAWYRRNGIGAPPVKPSDVLIIEQIDDDGIIRFREDVESPARIGMTLPEYLVSAEPDHTAAVIEAARKVLPNFRVGAYEEGDVTYTKVEIRMNGRWYVWEGRFDDAVAWAEDGLFATLQAQANAIDAYDESETP